MLYSTYGLDCPSCAAKIERELRKVKGLETVSLNFSALSIELPEELFGEAQAVINRVEPGVKLEKREEFPAILPRDSVTPKNIPWRIIVSAPLFIAGLVFNKYLHNTLHSWAEYAILLPAYLLVGGPVIKNALVKLFRGQFFDENFLMMVATLGAIGIRQLPEAVSVMLFFAVGEYLQDRAVDHSRRSVTALLNIQPEYANLKINGSTSQVDPRSVLVGQTILVRPGEKVPLDGTVSEGSSFVNAAALTGESVPRRVVAGEKVLSGMINGEGLLTVQVSKPYKDSSIARILDLVEKASARKAPTERFITRFARLYTPIVVVAALAIALLPPLLLPGATFNQWIYRSLILLVISCPCALVVSIPLGYFGGIGAASKNGILVKGANYMDSLAGLHTVVFDKTGTLTKGVFRVAEIVPKNISAEELLSAAAAAEVFSTHPIAQSIQAAYRETTGEVIKEEMVEDYREIPAHGVFARVGGQEILVGNDRLMHAENIPHQDCEVVGTTVYVAIDRKYVGYMLIADEVKADAKGAIHRLKQLGVQRIVVLSGDDFTATKKVSEEMGVDAYFAELLPEDKVTKIEELEFDEGGKQLIAFVGDGINDAPVLTRAGLGVAMGGLGSDAAIEAADVVLMEDAPSKLARGIEIARRTRRIVRQNIVFALGIKALFVILGVLGVANIWEAVFADVGVTILAVINAGRAIKVSHPLE